MNSLEQKTKNSIDIDRVGVEIKRSSWDTETGLKTTLEYIKTFQQKQVRHKGPKSSAEKNTALVLPQKRTRRCYEVRTPKKIECGWSWQGFQDVQGGAGRNLSPHRGGEETRAGLGR